MPMSFSLSGLMLISAAYLLVLFAVAWCADRGLILVEEQPLVPAYDLCLFDGIKVLALEILLRANRQHLLVADLPYHHW